MENVPPEDWPLVLANVHQAVRPGGLMYLTVEEVGQSHVDWAFERLCARGLPAVRGELVEGNVADYHYYPGRDQAVDWITHEGLTIVDEAFRWKRVGLSPLPSAHRRVSRQRRRRSHNTSAHQRVKEVWDINRRSLDLAIKSANPISSYGADHRAWSIRRLQLRV